MNKKQQLAERNVKQLAPETNPVDFMHRYVTSNFPETVAHPSAAQKAMAVQTQKPQDSLKLMQKPLSGTSYDNPAGS